MTNEDRADRAQAALDAYIAFTNDSPDESHFRDLLCDLMHLAARDGAGNLCCPEGVTMTFGQALEVAARAFEDEQELGKKYVELIPAGEGGPSPTSKHYVGVYTPEDGSIIGECSWHDTLEEAQARYDELIEQGCEVEDA